MVVVWRRWSAGWFKVGTGPVPAISMTSEASGRHVLTPLPPSSPHPLPPILEVIDRTGPKWAGLREEGRRTAEGNEDRKGDIWIRYRPR